MQNEEPTNTARDVKIDETAPELKELYEYERNHPAIIPTPNNPPWNSWIAVGVWVASILLIGIIPAFFILPYAALNGGLASLENIQNNSTAILLNMIGTIPAHLFTLILAWFVVTKNRKFSFKQTLGWSNGNFRWFYHVLIVIGFFAVAGVIGSFFPEQDNELMRILRSSRAVVFVVAFLATFTAPIVEEVVYRGLMYSAFQRTIGVKWAVVIVTALFALVHVPQYWGSPGTIFLICLLSLVLTLIRVKTDNLLPCIILHTIFNGIQSAVLIAEPYLPKPEVQIQEKAAALIGFFT